MDGNELPRRFLGKHQLGLTKFAGRNHVHYTGILATPLLLC